MPIHWTEPSHFAKERAAIWNRGRLSAARCGLLFLIICGSFSVALFLIVWIKAGKIAIPGALTGGAVLSLVLTPLLLWQLRARAIRMSLRLEEDGFVLSGTANRLGSYSELVGFAFAGEPDLRHLLLFHPEGRHISMGLEPALDVGSLREFLLTRLPEIAPEEAPEPKLW